MRKNKLFITLAITALLLGSMLSVGLVAQAANFYGVIDEEFDFNNDGSYVDDEASQEVDGSHSLDDNDFVDDRFSREIGDRIPFDDDDGPIIDEEFSREEQNILDFKLSVNKHVEADESILIKATIRNTGDTMVKISKPSICGKSLHLDITTPIGGTLSYHGPVITGWPSIVELEPTENVSTTVNIADGHWARNSAEAKEGGFSFCSHPGRYVVKASYHTLYPPGAGDAWQGGLTSEKHIFYVKQQQPETAFSLDSPEEGAEVDGTVLIHGEVYGTVSRTIWVSIDRGPWHKARVDSCGRGGAAVQGYWQYTWDTRNISNGNHRISVRALDGEQYEYESIQVRVNNGPENEYPHVDFTYSPKHLFVNEKVIFNASLSTDPNGEIIAYNWTISAPHFLKKMGEGKTIDYEWNRPGEYVVTLKITDNDGFTNSTCKIINVVKQTEKLMIHAPAFAHENDHFYISVQDESANSIADAAVFMYSAFNKPDDSDSCIKEWIDKLYEYDSPEERQEILQHIVEYSPDVEGRTDTSGEVIFTAPDVMQNTTYLIIASKQDYHHAFRTITIKNAVSNLDVDISKMVSVDNSSWQEDVTVEKGDPVYFRINVTNSGDTVLHNVAVKDYLPAFLNTSAGASHVDVLFSNTDTDSSYTHSFDLRKGWNLITIPVKNSFTARSLIDTIPNCTMVYGWDSINQTYQLYTVASPSVKNFAIRDGMGYLVYLNASKTFNVTGAPVGSATIDFYDGVNLIGWFNETSTNASLLADFIPGCVNISKQPFGVGDSPLDDSFDINRGDGLWVYTDMDSLSWYRNSLGVDETWSIYFNAEANSSGAGDNFARVGTDEGLLAEDTAHMNVISPEPKIEVNKQVKKNCDEEYHEGVTVEKGDKLTFKIVVSNTGNVPLDVLIEDKLPIWLAYSNHATVNDVEHEYDEVSYPKDGTIHYMWKIDDVAPQENIVLKFTSDVAQRDGLIDKNRVSVAGYYQDFTVQAQDEVQLNITSPQKDELYLFVYTEEGMIDSVEENELFYVRVVGKDEYGLYAIPDAHVMFDAITKTTNETGDVSFTASSVEKNTTFDITVSKHGFETNSTDILVIDVPEVEEELRIHLVPQSGQVNESSVFYVGVSDADGYAVSDVQVTFDEVSNETDATGWTSFVAPLVDKNSTFTITANKTGYKLNNTEIDILNVEENHAPTVNIVEPLDGAIVSGTIWVNATLMDADGDSIVERALLIDGDIKSPGGVGAQSSLDSTMETKEFFNQTVDTTTLDDGIYRITVRVYDEHNACGESIVTIEVDNNHNDSQIDVEVKVTNRFEEMRNLSAIEWSDAANVSIGSFLYFNITITNTGSHNLSNITIIEKIPPILKFLFSDFNHKNLTTENRTRIHECHRYANCRNPGGKWRYHIPVLVVEEGIGVSNFTVNATVDNETSISDKDSVVINVSGEKCFNISQVITKPQVSSIPFGSNITFNVTLSNIGDYQLHNITLFAAVHGTSYVESSTTPIYGSYGYNNITLIAWRINDSLESENNFSINYITKAKEEGEKLSLVYATAQSNNNQILLDYDRTFFSLLPPDPTPPNQPTDESPETGEENILVDTNLSVNVFDINGDKMNVTFYWGNGTEIGTVCNVSSGTRVEFNPGKLEYDTVYEWYVVVNDTTFNTTSDTWHFTTIAGSFDVPTEEDPMGLAWDGQYLWISINDYTAAYGDKIYKVDPLNGNVVSEIDSPSPESYGLAWNEQYLWLVDRLGGGDEFKKIEPSNGSVTDSFGSPTHNPYELTWDGDYVWYTDYVENRIYKMLPSDGNIDHYIPAPNGDPSGITWDGDNLWVADSVTGKIYKIDPADGSILDSFNSPGGNPGALTWDGSHLWLLDTDPVNYTVIRIYKIRVNQQSTPPNHPVDPSPTNGETGVSVNPTLSVDVSDNDGDCMNVSFYDAINDNLIGTVPNVANDSTASITWSDLQHNTNYQWYVIVNDSKHQAQSETWTFKTKSSSTGHHGGDNTAPTTSISITPAAPNGENDWFTTKPIINLTLSESGTIYYRWNSEEWQTYNSPLNPDQGVNTLYYYGKDTDENKESEHAHIFKVDTLLKKPEVTVDESYENIYFTYKENITLMSLLLNENEIKNKITKENNKTCVLSSKYLSLNEFYTLNITVKDKAGNQQTYTEILDFAKPSITLDLKDGARLNGKVNITAEADDGPGHVKSIAFYLDDELIKTASTSPYTLRLNTTQYKEGKHTLRVTATDGYSNTNSTAREIEIRQKETSSFPLLLFAAILAFVLIGVIVFLLFWIRKQKQLYPRLPEPKKLPVPEFKPIEKLSNQSSGKPTESH